MYLLSSERQLDPLQTTLTMFAALIAGFFIIQSLLGSVLATSPSTVPPTTLNITAIATNNQSESTLQCWQLKAPFKGSNDGKRHVALASL